MEELKNSVLSRYGLQNVNMRHSVLHFFWIVEDPYKKAIDNILKESPQSALRKDLLAIVGDFSKVYKKEACLVDVEQK